MNNKQKNIQKNQAGFSHVILPFVLLVIVAAVTVFAYTRINKATSNVLDPTVQRARDEADLKSKLSSGGSIEDYKIGCSGSGQVMMKHTPMDTSDLSLIQPVGMLAAAHVTPIDHLYFYSKGNTKRDANPVYAMADGFIVGDDIEERGQKLKDGKLDKGAIQIIVQHNCSTFSYYDLMTSLDPGIAAKLEKGEKRVAIKAGQVIGRVGGQSLDTAIFNADMKLTGFINPSSYSGEPWKIHVDDFFKYFSGKDKSDMLALNPRKIEPYGGKIDFDVTNKLQGNWFQIGTNGYSGPEDSERINIGDVGYFSGHFSIAPDVVTPSKINISFGNYEGKPQQFTALSSSPDPANVGIDSGLVKYELTPYKQPTLSHSVQDKSVKGTVLLQVTDGGKQIKMETFPGKLATQATEFTSAAKTYER